MKKILAFGLTLLLLAALAVPVSASAGTVYENAGETSEPETFANAWALFESWETNGYPDYVSGVWTETGGMEELVVGITEEGGEAARREILALIENDASVSFVTQKYSYNYLRGVQEDITAYLMEHEIGSWGIGVSVMRGTVELFLEHNTDHEETALVIKELMVRYGDIVQIETGHGPIVTYDLEIGSAVVTDTAVHPGKQLMIWPPMALVLLLVALGAILIARRRTAVMQTATGETVTTGGNLTAAQVEDMIKTDAPAPSAELDRKVLSQIKK